MRCTALAPCAQAVEPAAFLQALFGHAAHTAEVLRGGLGAACACEVEGLQGSNGELSSKCADLKASKAANKMQRSEAKTIRDKEQTSP